VSAFTLRTAPLTRLWDYVPRVEILMGYYAILDRRRRAATRAMRSRPGFAAMTSTSKTSGLAPSAPAAAVEPYSMPSRGDAWGAYAAHTATQACMFVVAACGA
jgi:hypothetical protein